MFGAFGKIIKDAKTQIGSAINIDNSSDNLEETVEESLGKLWEDIESVNKCRHCLEDFALPFLKRKHHCRQCGGVFCNECCPKPNNTIDTNKKKSNKINTTSKTNVNERRCFGCLHDETPGEHLQFLIKVHTY